ncbi:MAG: T9SS type A sorting domain-containing protein [Bacteroidota bacterium]|nr:T9SS type A sorting domain-containing protein [Bacteroidota bacterium]
MKKILSSVFLLISIIVNAQFPTLATTYTTGVNPLNAGISSTFILGRLYHVMEKTGEGMVVQKSDVNGTPIMARSYNTFTVGWGNPKIISNSTGLYFINRENNGLLMLMKVDTTSCLPVFTRTYSVAGFNNFIHKDVNFLSSGKILVVGSVGNGFFNEDAGVVLCIDPAANGAVVYSHTLSISGSTANAIYSYLDMSNSTILLSGKSNVSDFFSKASKTPTTFSINAGSTFASNVGGSIIYKLSNQKRMMVYKDVSNTVSSVCKIDTNLTLLNSTPAANAISWNHSGGIKSFSYLNKLFVWSNLNNYIDVIDSAMNTVSTKTFNINNGLVFRDVTNSLSNLYISQVRASPIDAKMGTIKSDFNGDMACMNTYSVAKLSYSVTGNTVAFNSGSVVVTTGFINPVVASLSITSVQSCTCMPPSMPSITTPSANLNICAGNSATLMASGSGTINWYSTGTSTVVIGTGSLFVTSTLSTGTYTFFAGDQTCTSSLNRSNVIVNVSPCTGIEEVDKLEHTSLYPNPSNGSFNLSVAFDVNVKIHDVLGNLVYQGELKKGVNAIDLYNISEGLYFVKVELGSIEKVLKYIKQ